ncbi:DUF7553 family protein [Halobellus limi]|jgi:hypothetical protein|uniref:Uncharacterized protein n=1 Tax=Halobellus limi TaxID=699433 RepID=A0A1H5WT51_9EURY|nr:hypothetical protein [Halobellus limi]QCC46349.1 hypothetical protein DV707_00890 [Halobellus limi]SEG02493.1 hypothetical protein SAMN04488133_1383 [Halobellus limi]
MSHELLEAASQRLRDASEAADGDVQRRIYEQSDALATLAARDRKPDHGRLARHMNALAELAEATDGTAHEAVVDARAKVSEFREGVEGV